MLQDGEILKERYRIKEVLGLGAFGTVYQAEDLTIPHVIWAVKEMDESLAEDGERGEVIRRFEHEARILQHLNHLEIPKLVDFGISRFYDAEKGQDTCRPGTPGFFVVKIMRSQTLVSMTTRSLLLIATRPDYSAIYAALQFFIRHTFKTFAQCFRHIIEAICRECGAPFHI